MIVGVPGRLWSLFVNSLKLLDPQFADKFLARILDFAIRQSTKENARRVEFDAIKHQTETA